VSSPTISNKGELHHNSKRKQAHALFLAGQTLDYVVTALSLKRATASVYLFEARKMAQGAADLLK
jgi:hypothetical protein